jgi:signal transduction histidine kinase
MNRLWVRLSLVFTLVVIVVLFVIALTIRLSNAIMTEPLTPPPPEVAAYFERIRAQQTLPPATTVLIVAGLVAVAAGVWMSRSLTAPLAELEEAAQAVGQQDFSQRVPVQGSQELVAVATAFNEMAARLEQAEALRRNLLADVAHELRHPIHVLQGSLQAILDEVYPLSVEEVGRLSDQTHHLARLVDDLHVLAQAEAQQLPLQKQKLDLATLVKETAGLFQPLAANQAITLRVELLGTMPTLAVDPARMRQALHNLLDNALRHTSSGGAVTVSVEQLEQTVQIRVQDTGEGIASQELPNVFDRFYRGDGGQGRDREGAGLGLAIVRAIVQAHGGTVTASSPGHGQGSTFAISLPKRVQ